MASDPTSVTSQGNCRCWKIFILNSPTTSIMSAEPDIDGFVAIMDEMKASFTSVRELLRPTLLKAQSTADLDVKDGISLLSLRNETLLSYLQSLVLISAHRVLGHSLLSRDPPPTSFDDPERRARGSGAGDLVDSAVEARAVLEKSKVLEFRLKYQIQKLVRLAQDATATTNDITQGKTPGSICVDRTLTFVSDPLAFRPNIHNLMVGDGPADDASDMDKDQTQDKIYRPPKLAPTPYMETFGKEKSRQKVLVPTTLEDISRLDPSAPYVESTSGLGDQPVSAKAATKLDKMAEFEEDHMVRFTLSKKEAKKRGRDEMNAALGGTGAATRRGAELEGEFTDIFRSVNRKPKEQIGDGYEELRQRGKRAGAFARSKMRMGEEPMDGDNRPQKRNRFHE
ncbi:uncharacterized protein EI90DRAFT_3288255 [Cantharellus anzutake]|uniref:uncharacterized protein n=1 Tax=Cantharellus anzutake TaxID=1750568 RepID=UPI001903EFF5|nr:uncharacterized protein EI90DRAFT_3288255 [Cantharellus anzutake]KAF8333957.1 hypothetical protein EI90DRAFT_3288255 [Cantharellus anzutake]